MAAPGISTVGAIFSYAVETTAGTKPSTWTKLTRINAIGGINIDTEEIDASALEDEIERSIAGRGSTGGNFTVTINVTNETITEWETLLSAAATAKTANKQTWFQTSFPNLTKSYFVVAEPPTKIPQPEVAQNGLLTAEMTLTINEYKGLDTKVAPTP